MHQLKGCSHKPRPYISSISDTVSSFGIIIIVFCIKVFIIQPFEVQTTNFVFTLTHTQWTLCYWVWCFLLWGSSNKPLTCIYNAVKKYLPLSDFFFLGAFLSHLHVWHQITWVKTKHFLDDDFICASGGKSYAVVELFVINHSVSLAIPAKWSRLKDHQK